ncbi:CsgG/HfaB family protein [Planctomycetaceae bacterium SH139]
MKSLILLIIPISMMHGLVGLACAEPVSVAILPFHARTPITADSSRGRAEIRSRIERTSTIIGQETENERRSVLGDSGTRSRDITNRSVTTTEMKTEIFNSEQEKDIADTVVDLLTIKLLTSPNIMLVERNEIDRIYDELKLSRAGIVNSAEANQVGRLSGAKLLVTGSVVQIDNDLFLIAKVMGTETSRIAGASVKAPANSDLNELVDKLATELEKVFSSKTVSLLPKVETENDWIYRVTKRLADKKLPTVTVQLETKKGQLDLAAVTELERLLKELGFDVVAGDHLNARRAELAIVGEAKSEFAYRRGDWVATRCRIDLQIRSQGDGKVLASDSETCMVFDIAEQQGGKEGLQDAMRRLAERVATKMIW